MTFGAPPAGLFPRIYRTEAGGSIYRFVAEIRDGSTTFVDAKADSELGDVAPSLSTLGVLAGVTSLPVQDASVLPGAGWARIASQLISWTGKSGNTLTGIPTTGDGSIKSAIAAGSNLVAVPMLTGVTGMANAIAAGDTVNIYEVRNDTAAQAARAAAEGRGDGVIEYPVTNSNLARLEARARGDAELALFSRPLGSVTYVSRDTKTRSGKVVHIDLPSHGLLGDFTIQTVTIDQLGTAGLFNPRYSVQASSVRFSLEDELRRLLSRRVA